MPIPRPIQRLTTTTAISSSLLTPNCRSQTAGLDSSWVSLSYSTHCLARQIALQPHPLPPYAPAARAGSSVECMAIHLLAQCLLAIDTTVDDYLARLLDTLHFEIRDTLFREALPDNPPLSVARLYEQSEPKLRDLGEDSERP